MCFLVLFSLYGFGIFGLVNIILYLLLTLIALAIMGAPFICTWLYSKIAVYVNKIIPLFIRKLLVIASFIIPIAVSSALFTAMETGNKQLRTLYSEACLFFLFIPASCIAIAYTIRYFRHKKLWVVLLITMAYYLAYLFTLGIIGFAYRNS